MSNHDPFDGLCTAPRAPAASLGSAGLPITPAWVHLHTRFGNARVADGNEMQEIMQVVSAYLQPSSWEYCAINAWLNGTPSEDDLGFFGYRFTEMPTLEEVCGDHVWIGSQFSQAFKTLREAGAPEGFVRWLNVKGAGVHTVKTTKTNQEGDANVKKAAVAAADAVTPSSETLTIGSLILLAAGVLWLAARR